MITVNIGKVVSIPSDFTLPTTSTQPLVVTHCITVRNDFSWTAFVHGHCVSDSVSPILSSIPKQLNRDSLISLIVKLDNCNVCPGHTDNRFVDMLISRGGKITSCHGDDIVASLDTSATASLLKLSSVVPCTWCSLQYSFCTSPAIGQQLSCPELSARVRRSP